MILYFSGCGNSRFVAERLADTLQERLLFIPGADSSIDLQEDEALGFVFPVYAWAPPRLALDFVRRMQLRAVPSYVWFACTCGDEGGYTRQVFARTLRKKGLALDACFCLQMPETYIAFPGFSLDTPDNAKRKISLARAELPRITGLIANRTRQHYEMIRGTLPLTKTYLLRPLFYRFIITDRRFHANEACVGCGKCVESCSLHNIRMVDNRPGWQGNCTHCMSCYHHCPTNAIQYGGVTRGKEQYYFGRDDIG